MNVPSRRDLLNRMTSDWGRIDHTARPTAVTSTGPSAIGTRTRRANSGLTEEAGLLALDAPTQPKCGLGAALARRRAQRVWSGQPVSGADLAAMAGAALACANDDWQAQTSLGLTIGLRLVACQVTGVPAGVYRFDGARSLRQLASGVAGTDLSRHVLQREFIDAPLILLAVGSMRDALRLYGTHGYRALLLRGAAGLQAAWLAGVQRGLVGTVFAGLLPHALRAHSDVDGYLQTAILALAIGVPATVDHN